ncbi:MAG: acireductone synthase [Prochlorococcaceae cyanobacterium]
MPANLTSADEASCRDALSAAMADIHRRGWCDGTGGNFSCVLQQEPLHMLMAPSGVAKGSVPPEQLIVVDGHGQLLRGSGRTSAETLLHLAIVNVTGAGAVLHTHSQAATLLSQRVGRHHPGELVLEGLEMLKGLEGIKTHATAVALPVLPNDQDLTRLSAAAEPLLADAPCGLLIAGHGLYAWGADLAAAQRHLEILEFLLEQRWRELLLEPAALKPVVLEGISHALLDIEGTTCAISFVSQVLFPYAAAQLDSFLAQNAQQQSVQALVQEIEQCWQHDADAAAAGVRWQPGATVLPYLRWLMAQDRKVTPLKDLQGLIWQQGYAKGELVGPLFADVAPALQRWKRAGVTLAVYSSGSIQAQQLLYGHSDAGDLRECFSAWFDTRTGSKQSHASYQAIATSLQCKPEQMVFISDATSELEAAQAAGLQVLLAERPGNQPSTGDGFARINAFSALHIAP